MAIDIWYPKGTAVKVVFGEYMHLGQVGKVAGCNDTGRFQSWRIQFEDGAEWIDGRHLRIAKREEGGR